MAKTAQGALNDKNMARDAKALAADGEGGDDHIAHLSTDDAVIPMELRRRNPRVDELLKEIYTLGNLNPHQFVLGHPGNEKNKKTGLPQFADSSGGGDGGGGGGGDGGGGGGGGDSGGGGGADAGGGSAEGGRAEGGAGSSTGGPGTGAASGDTGGGGLTGRESQTAVEGMAGATAPKNSFLDAGAMGTLGQFGQPTTDIGFVDSGLNAVMSHPVETAINAVGGLLVPGMGFANMAAQGINAVTGSNIPSVGGAITSAGRAIGASIGDGLTGDPSKSADASGGGGSGASATGGAPASAPTTTQAAASLLGASATPKPTTPAAPKAAAPTAAPTTVKPSIAPAFSPTPQQKQQIAQWKQNQQNSLFQDIANSGGSPERDSRYIAGAQQIQQMADADIAKTLGFV